MNEMDVLPISVILDYLENKRFITRRFQDSFKSGGYIYGYYTQPILKDTLFHGYKYTFPDNNGFDTSYEAINNKPPLIWEQYLDRGVKAGTFTDPFHYLLDIRVPVPFNWYTGIPPGNYDIYHLEDGKINTRQIVTYRWYPSDTSKLCADGDAVFIYWKSNTRVEFYHLIYDMGKLRRLSEFIGTRGGDILTINDIVENRVMEYDDLGYASYVHMYLNDISYEVSKTKINGRYVQKPTGISLTVVNDILEGEYTFKNGSVSGTFRNTGMTIYQLLNNTENETAESLEKRSIYTFDVYNGNDKHTTIYLDELSRRHGVAILNGLEVITYIHGTRVNHEEYLKYLLDDPDDAEFVGIIDDILGGEYPEISSIIGDFWGDEYNDYIDHLSDMYNSYRQNYNIKREDLEFLNEVGKIILEDDNVFK